jgi:hypothetical protein
MAIVDDRGRLFGRLNLLDAVLLVLLAGLVPLGYAAYALFREQPARITSITPSRAEQSANLRLAITGENFRPFMRVSADNYQAVDFVFKSTTEVEAPFGPLPPGEYDIVLYDQAQERFRLPNALRVVPSALPATEIIAVGAFGNLDAAGAAKITAGLELPDVGRIVAVGKPQPDLTQVFSSSALVGVPMPNAQRLPATVLFRCYVKTQQGRPHCVVDDAPVAPPNLIMLPTPMGKTPFQVEHVRSSHPLEPVQIRVRVAGHPSVLSQIRSGDVDLGGTGLPRIQERSTSTSSRSCNASTASGYTTPCRCVPVRRSRCGPRDTKCAASSRRFPRRIGPAASLDERAVTTVEVRRRRRRRACRPDARAALHGCGGSLSAVERRGAVPRSPYCAARVVVARVGNRADSVDHW